MPKKLTTDEFILYWDFDTPIHAACSVCEDRYILAKHIASGRTKEFKNVTEFWGSKKKEIGGWLSQQPKKWVRDDFEIIQKRRRNGVPLYKAQEFLKGKIELIKSQDYCRELKLVVQGKGNYRTEIYKKYKSNRPKDKPIVFSELKDSFIKEYNPIIENGMETDDTISILQHWSYNNFGKNSEYGFVFVDKDLEQTPCWRVNPNKIDEGIYWIDENYANRVFFESILSGDSSDNIPGIVHVTEDVWKEYKLRGKKFNIGKGNAKKLIQSCKNKHEMVYRVQGIYKETYPEDWRNRLSVNYKLLKLLEKKGEIQDFPFTD